MADIQTGANALDVLNKSDDSGGFKFTSFKVGSKFIVKVLGVADLMQYYSYGIFGEIDTFVAKNPSKKSAKGYPVENYTPWDLAWKYHKDKSGDFNDYHGKEASNYKVKQRFALGFLDLDSGEPMVIDVSKNQAQAIHAAIKKNENKLDRKAFELSKTGGGQNTVVSLMPEDLEDLTDKQRKNFDNAPEEFDMKLFEGILYEADEDEQIQSLQKAGFDVTLIGLSPQTNTEAEEESSDKEDEGVTDVGSGENGEILDDDLPF